MIIKEQINEVTWPNENTCVFTKPLWLVNVISTPSHGHSISSHYSSIQLFLSYKYLCYLSYLF